MRNDETLLTSAEAAAVLGVSLATLRRHTVAGVVPIATKLPGQTGAYLFHRDTIHALANREEAS